MEESLCSLNSNKSDSWSVGKSLSEGENNSTQKISTRSILRAIGSKFFSGIQAEPKATEEKRADKTEAEEAKVELSKKKSIHDMKMKPNLTKIKRGTVDECWKRNDRDLLQFKANYYATIGKITRTWMSLIYCILILRMNLIKFFQENPSEFQYGGDQLQSQLREENMTIFRMIKDAQNVSQDRSLSVWENLEKLMYSRKLIKNALNSIRTTEAKKNWKGAAAKLADVEKELEKVKVVHDSLVQNESGRHETDAEFARMETLNAAKEKEMEKIIDQISALKKKEVQMKGRILLNMKNYKDLFNERKHLLEVQKEINVVRCNQNVIAREYAVRIQEIKNQIEENEKQIKMEKEEIRKLRLSLDVVGDASLNSVAMNET